MEVLLFALFFIFVLIFFIAGKDDFGRKEIKLETLEKVKVSSESENEPKADVTKEPDPAPNPEVKQEPETTPKAEVKNESESETTN